MIDISAQKPWRSQTFATPNITEQTEYLPSPLQLIISITATWHLSGSAPSLKSGASLCLPARAQLPTYILEQCKHRPGHTKSRRHNHQWAHSLAIVGPQWLS